MKKIFSTKYSDNYISFALLLLRIAFGGLMIHHGYQKLTGFASGAAGFSDPFHIGGPASMALVIFAEFFCAVLLVLGLMTRLACIPLIITMAVAFYKAHNGVIYGKSGGEMALIYLLGYLALLFTGPGKISLDRLIGK